MGNDNEGAAEARADALARRLEARAEAQAAQAEAQRLAAEAARVEAERIAAHQSQQSHTGQNYSVQTAVARFTWDPTGQIGDDREAHHDDGQEHPDEDAIRDREALHEAKRDAWLARADRLNRQGKVLAAGRALGHAEWHGWRCEP